MNVWQKKGGEKIDSIGDPLILGYKAKEASNKAV